MKKNYGIAEWTLMFLLSLIWGSSFILMKRGLETFSPSQVAAIRMFSAFLFLFPFVISEIKNIPREKWKFIAASGLIGNGIPAFLFALAQTKISSSVAGILNSLTPLFAMLIAVVVFKNKISHIHAFAIFLGFAGAVTIMVFRANGSFDGNFYYGLLCILSTAMYGLSVNILKNFLKELRPLHITGFAMCIAGIPYGFYLFTTDFTEKISAGGTALHSLLFVLILGVVGTAVSLVLFNKLIKTTSVLFASSVTYLIPVVALMWGFMDGEKLGAMQLCGLAAILTGVYIVNRH